MNNMECLDTNVIDEYRSPRRLDCIARADLNRGLGSTMIGTMLINIEALKYNYINTKRL